MSVLKNEEDRVLVDQTPQEAYNDIIKYTNAQRRGICGSGVVTKKLINPSNDFFSYVNQTWIRSKKLSQSQKYIIQIDNFRLAQDAVYNQLINIVNDSSTPAPVKDLYASLKTHMSSSSVLHHVHNYIHFLDKCIAEDNLWKLLAYLNTNEMTRYACPVSWDVSPDEKNSKMFITHITYPELSLYDYRYYLQDKHDNDKSNKSNKSDSGSKHTRMNKNKKLYRHRRKQNKTRRNKNIEYKRNVLTKFVTYVDRIFNALGLGSELNGTDVLQIEKSIIRNMACYIEPEPETKNGKKNDKK